MDATIHHVVASIRKGEVLLVNAKLLVANRETDNWETVGRGRTWEDPSLLTLVILGAWNGSVNGVTERIINKCKSGASVSDGAISRSGNGLAVDSRRCGFKLPETLAVVNRSVADAVGTVNTVGGKHILVNEAKGIERFVTGVLGTGKVGGEKFGLLWNVVLGNHVLHRCCDWRGLDSVDTAPGKTQKTVTRALDEFGRHLFGYLDGLVLDGQTADSDRVKTNVTRSRGIVSILDLWLGISISESDIVII